jgi:hypothetical protein
VKHGGNVPHKALNNDQLEVLAGYLESVKNLATCAEILVRIQPGLLYTVCEEMAVNCQHIIDEFCTVDE